MSSLKQVAEAAGVSIRTVNRVLKSNGYVGTQTREKVERAVAEIQYHPNLHARSLKTRRSYEIAVLINSFDQLHMEKCAALETVLKAAGYYARFTFTDDALAPASLPVFSGSAPAGLVLFDNAQLAQDLTPWVKEHRIPHLLIGWESKPWPMIGVDRAHGVAQAVDHLVERAHERIAFLGQGNARNFTNASRLRGYHAAMKKHGLKREVIMLPLHDKNGDNHQACTQLCLGRHRPPAIIASTDTLAMKLMQAAYAKSIRIPEELAVVGFDNRPMAEYASPPLTTVAQPNREIGACAAATLLNWLAAPDSYQPPRQQLLPTNLIIRETT